MKPADLPPGIRERIVVTESGCWEWTGHRTEKGYGQVYFGGTTRRVHRVVWELLVAPLTPGLELHHRCENESCCNPADLEECTTLYNVNQKPGVNKSHCVHGHALTEANTRVQVRNGHISRGCKTCAREQKAARRQLARTS